MKASHIIWRRRASFEPGSDGINLQSHIPLAPVLVTEDGQHIEIEFAQDIEFEQTAHDMGVAKISFTGRSVRFEDVQDVRD